MPDAVVIGSGPNGLVAANLLADEGWDVVVLEAQPTPGGAVRTEELTAPGFHHDVFSAFYPFAVASPVMAHLELDRYGLEWMRSPLVVAHPTPDGRCAALSMDIDETAASLDAFAPGDGDAWRRLWREWQRVNPAMVDALFAPFPPVKAGVRLALALNRDLIRFARFALLPVRRLAEERFRGEGGGLLLGGNALHADLAPEGTLSGTFGWLLCMLGQEHGFPVPKGGAGSLTAALVRRLEAKGGRLECNARVRRVVVHRGKAVAVRTADGREIDATRAVLADVAAPSLFLDLVGAEHLPLAVVDGLERFQWDNATVKVDWSLDAPIPWSAAEARRAGTVHIAESMDHLTEGAAQLAMGRIPSRPYLVFGQYSMVDGSRQPAGAETAWAYTHVPQRVKGDAGGDLTGTWDEREADAFARRMEDQVEAYAPGFRDLIRGRHILTPPGMQSRNESLNDGALNGGTAQLHQQLVFRPIPGLGRPETPIANLFLASASAHPGGGVHGAPGANAVQAVLSAERRRKLLLVAGASAGVLSAAGAARRR
jgi:phytoene dehydrogenase-like protein